MPERPQTLPPRILIVDDSAADRQAVSAALRRQSFPAGGGSEVEIVEAASMAEARERLECEDIACVFLSHTLPDGSSLDLLMELRARGLATPVVVLTGERDEDTIDEVMRAGAADFLPKTALEPDLVARSLRAALRFLGVQREKQTVLDDLRVRDSAIAAAANGIVIADARLPDAPLIYTNEAFLQMTGFPREEVIGYNCRFLQGPDTHPDAVRERREAMKMGRKCQGQILNYRKDGTPFWNEVTVSPVRNAQDVVTYYVGIQTDTTARQMAEGERIRLLELATRQAAEMAAVIEQMPAGVYLGTKDGISLSNRLGREMLGLDTADDLAHSIPTLAATLETRYADTGERILPEDEIFSKALRGERVEREVILRNTRTGQDLVVRSAAAPIMENGRIVGAVAINSDVTERKQIEEAQRQSEAHYRAIIESLAEGITVQDVAGIVRSLNPSAERILGITEEQVIGLTLADDRWEAVREDGTPLPGAEHPSQAALRTGQPQRAVVMGLHRPDGTQVWLSVNAQPIAHPETGEPLGVVTSFFDITIQRAARQALQARAVRETLLNRIGQAQDGETSPEDIQALAVNLLGEALGADRCYLGVYDLPRSIVSIFQEWRRAGLTPLVGTYSFPNTSEMFRELYRDRAVSVVEDSSKASLSARTQANMNSLGLRSRLSVALTEADGLLATLTAAMTDAPRAWTDDETALVQAVAMQLRTSVEMARVARREHTIATQLQEALQPDLPGKVPGLALAKYYRPALADSEGVGGDFYDVYALEKGCTALVVGDLSGKGLAAAAQVSTVRNMLRAFLYSQPTLAEAMTLLNRVLSENALLTGFTTLFAGCYDSATGVFQYVNCGQEPALIWRAADGRVEPLDATGAIMGAIEGAEYVQSHVLLRPGDALALFTDGLTEVGASRSNLLGVEGVSALLESAAVRMQGRDAAETAETLTSDLIGGVDLYAQSGARDDMCLLLAVVEGR